MTYLTKRAFLPSAGLNERRATLHIYSHSELITLPAADGTAVTGIGHFYRCKETDALRRWGFEIVIGPPEGN